MSNKLMNLTHGELTSLSNIGEAMFVTSTEKQKEKREQELKTLIGSELGKKVFEEWQIEVLYGWASALKRQTHAVKLTNIIIGESMTFLKHEIQDVKNVEQILKTLSIIGVVERNYIRFFGNYLNIVRALPDRVTKVKDLSLVASEKNSEVGFSVQDYYKFFVQDYFGNPNLYPARSSNLYKKGSSHGIILDADNHEYFKNEYGYYPVAIKAGKLEDVFPYMSDQEFSQVIQHLNHLEVLHISISERIERGIKRAKRKIKMVDMIVKKNDREYHDEVYIFNIIPTLLEGKDE